MSFIEEKFIFANRLREEREKLGLMQKEMAQKLEIPPNTNRQSHYNSNNKMIK